MKNILFINACVRKESRTRQLADYALGRLGGRVTEIDLQREALQPWDAATLIRRDQYIKEKDYSDEMFRYAKQLVEADIIVIAAPFWDLSFPAFLKVYCERVMVSGLTFDYTEEEVPFGYCRAERVIYITTAGAQIFSEEPGYGYIRDLAKTFWGISESVLIKAEGLDLRGADVEKILEEARRQIDRNVVPDMKKGKETEE